MSDKLDFETVRRKFRAGGGKCDGVNRREWAFLIQQNPWTTNNSRFEELTTKIEFAPECVTDAERKEFRQLRKVTQPSTVTSSALPSIQGKGSRKQGKDNQRNWDVESLASAYDPSRFYNADGADSHGDAGNSSSSSRSKHTGHSHARTTGGATAQNDIVMSHQHADSASNRGRQHPKPRRNTEGMNDTMRLGVERSGIRETRERTQAREDQTTRKEHGRAGIQATAISNESHGRRGDTSSGPPDHDKTCEEEQKFSRDDYEKLVQEWREGLLEAKRREVAMEDYGMKMLLMQFENLGNGT